MDFTDLNSDTLDRIGLLLNTPLPLTPPVNSMQGVFNQTVALRRNAISKYSSVSRSFDTPAAMIHQEDLVSGRALFYALSRAAPAQDRKSVV